MCMHGQFETTTHKLHTTLDLKINAHSENKINKQQIWTDEEKESRVPFSPLRTVQCPPSPWERFRPSVSMIWMMSDGDAQTRVDG